MHNSKIFRIFVQVKYPNIQKVSKMKNVTFENIDFLKSPVDFSNLDFQDTELYFKGCSGFQGFKFPESLYSVYFDDCLNVNGFSDTVRITGLGIMLYGYLDINVIDFKCFDNFTGKDNTSIGIVNSTILDTSAFSSCDNRYIVMVDTSCTISQDVIAELSEKEFSFDYTQI